MDILNPSPWFSAGFFPNRRWLGLRTWGLVARWFHTADHFSTEKFMYFGKNKKRVIISFVISVPWTRNLFPNISCNYRGRSLGSDWSAKAEHLVDILRGFHQLAKHKSVFVVQGKQYEWNRIPFGCQGSPWCLCMHNGTCIERFIFQISLDLCWRYFSPIWLSWMPQEMFTGSFNQLNAVNPTLKARK